MAGPAPKGVVMYYVKVMICDDQDIIAEKIFSMMAIFDGVARDWEKEILGQYNIGIPVIRFQVL